MIRLTTTYVATAAGLMLLAGCASQKPVLYSASDGDSAGGQQAIDRCEQRAQEAGLDYDKGRVGGGFGFGHEPALAASAAFFALSSSIAARSGGCFE